MQSLKHLIQEHVSKRKMVFHQLVSPTAETISKKGYILEKGVNRTDVTEIHLNV